MLLELVSSFFFLYILWRKVNMSLLSEIKPQMDWMELLRKIFIQILNAVQAKH